SGARTRTARPRSRSASTGASPASRDALTVPGPGRLSPGRWPGSLRRGRPYVFLVLLPTSGAGAESAREGGLREARGRAGGRRPRRSPFAPATGTREGEHPGGCGQRRARGGDGRKAVATGEQEAGEPAPQRDADAEGRVVDGQRHGGRRGPRRGHDARVECRNAGEVRRSQQAEQRGDDPPVAG